MFLLDSDDLDQANVGIIREQVSTSFSAPTASGVSQLGYGAREQILAGETPDITRKHVLSTIDGRHNAEFLWARSLKTRRLGVDTPMG